MKKMLIILFAAGIYSCGNNPSATGQATTESVADKAADSITNKQDTLNALWINDFRNFRNAVYQNDVNKLKTYFKFPVLNPYNEIWSVQDTREYPVLTNRLLFYPQVIGHRENSRY